MTNSLDDISINVTMDFYEARVTKTTLEAKIRKIQRQQVKKPFEPEPGKLDMNKVRIGTLQGIVRQIDEHLDQELLKRKLAS